MLNQGILSITIASRQASVAKAVAAPPLSLQVLVLILSRVPHSLWFQGSSLTIKLAETSERRPARDHEPLLARVSMAMQAQEAAGIKPKPAEEDSDDSSEEKAVAPAAKVAGSVLVRVDMKWYSEVG
jgi:hypothetical protein